MRRCVWKDENKELFVNPLQKGTTWADGMQLGSYLSFPVYQIYN